MVQNYGLWELVSHLVTSETQWLLCTLDLNITRFDKRFVRTKNKYFQLRAYFIKALKHLMELRGAGGLRRQPFQYYPTYFHNVPRLEAK
jgi:hypothetical protein